MQLLATALVLILIAAILHIGEAAYIAFAFTGAFVTHVMFQPGRRDLGAAVLAGAGFAAIYRLHHGGMLDFFGNWIGVPGAFLGMGSLLVLAAQWIWAAPYHKRQRLERVRDAALVPLLCVGSMLVVGPAIALSPLTYDHVLYLFDAKFVTGFAGSPSWVVGRAFRDHAWLYRICGYVYNSLPLGLAICLALQWRDRLQKIWYPLDLRWLSMTLGGFGFLLYQVCPAAGPIYLFPKQFPFEVPALASIMAAPALLEAVVPRNGMPSLHFGWTLLLFWNMRRRAWWIALAAGAYVSLTALATLGLGEHYLADLIVAVPVALTLQALWIRTRTTMRWVAMGAGTAITMAWLIVFRTGVALEIPSGAAAWTAAGLTVAIPGLLAWRLERGLERGVEPGVGPTMEPSPAPNLQRSPAL
jgi:hypothetical protein